MIKRIYIIVLITVVALIPVPVSGSENITSKEAFNILYGDRSSSLSVEEKRDLAKYLVEGTAQYLAQVKQISPLSFRGRNDLSAENAGFLLNEADDVAAEMETLISVLEVIQDDRGGGNDVAWVFVARQISVNISYMEDLSRWDLVDSNWNVALRIYLPGIFDRIIVPQLEIENSKQRNN